MYFILWKQTATTVTTKSGKVILKLMEKWGIWVKVQAKESSDNQARTPEKHLREYYTQSSQ